jgi:hypothetical protein
MSDLIERQAAITAIQKAYTDTEGGTDKPAVWKNIGLTKALHIMQDLPSAQPEDYTEMKQEFLRMASYIDVLLKCSDEQKETLMGFISRLAEFMPWTKRD